LIPEENVFFSSQTGIPKHEKKDYRNLSDMPVNKIFEYATVENKKQEYKKDVRSKYGDMVKIEKKKKEIA
jgi:hypothetical protein